LRHSLFQKENRQTAGKTRGLSTCALSVNIPMKEKRKFQRVAEALPIKLSGLDADVLTETKNISASGAYCSVDKPIPEMTKLNIVLLVPMKNGRIKNVRKINCKGIVVRRQVISDALPRPYNIGIYFSDIKERDRKALVSYITKTCQRIDIHRLASANLS